MADPVADSLRSKRCVPCEGGVPRLERDEITQYLAGLPAWALSADSVRIRRDLKCKNFVAAMQMLQRVAEVAEREQHHPDLHLTSYRMVAIEIYTHAIGGLSENDFILAAKIDAVV